MERKPKMAREECTRFARFAESRGADIRLCRFWSKTDDWWELTPRADFDELIELLGRGIIRDDFPLEDAMKNIEPCVEEAMTRVKEYAVPYLAKIAKKHGYELRTSD